MNLIKNLAEHLESDPHIDHAELTKFNAKIENIRLSVCALSDLLTRLNSPARGEASQIEWMFKELDALSGMRDTPESHDPDLHSHGNEVDQPEYMSSSMLRTMVSREQLEEKYPRGISSPYQESEKGYELPKHQHFTRDIKPFGECPSCDEYWRNREKVLGLKPDQKYEASKHCNFCWKETETREGDCVDCGFSKVPGEKLDVKKWIGGDGKDD